MAARQTLRISSASTKTLFRRSSSSLSISKPININTLPSPHPPSASRSFLPTFRLPVELASLQSLMPFHSVTASALFTSLLSLHNNSWGCLSEGFATPL